MRVLCVENSAILKRTTHVLFVSRPFSSFLSLSLSLESKANTKVVSKLSCERVFMEKRTDGFPQRERERESFRTRTRAEKHDHARLYCMHAFVFVEKSVFCVNWIFAFARRGGRLTS